jgi:co-chaperonin GroES (HSP10)
MDNITLLGDRVLIQLHKLPDHTVSEKGIVMPLFQNIESDGGRPDVKASNLEYLSVGTVLKISALAKQKLADSLSPLSEGDTVYLPQVAVSPSYQFFTKRTGLVENFEGIIAVPHTLIEAIKYV